MKDLKLILFEHVRKALDEYRAAELEFSPHALDALNGGFDGLKRIMRDRYERFCAVWDVIEAAGLVDEYQAWKEARR